MRHLEWPVHRGKVPEPGLVGSAARGTVSARSLMGLAAHKSCATDQSAICRFAYQAISLPCRSRSRYCRSNDRITDCWRGGGAVASCRFDVVPDEFGLSRDSERGGSGVGLSAVRCRVLLSPFLRPVWLLLPDQSAKVCSSVGIARAAERRFLSAETGSGLRR